MDNGVAELEVAFADLHLEFRHHPGIENSAAGSKPWEISVEIGCGSSSSAMFSPKDGPRPSGRCNLLSLISGRADHRR